MALTGSGQLSLDDIATEKLTSLSNVSLFTLSTTDINPLSPSKPDGLSPYSVSKFYGYDHTTTISGDTTLLYRATTYGGSGNVIDLTTPQYNGTLFNGAGYITDPIDAFSFDGSNDYLQVSDNSDLTPGSDDFTIIAWAKYTGPTLSSTSVLSVLYGKGQYNGTGLSEYLFTYRGGSYNGMYFRIRTNTKILNVQASSDQTSIIEDEEYHMITVTINRSNDTIQMYLDENEVANVEGGFDISTTSQPLYLGRYLTIYGSVDIASFEILKGKSLSSTEVEYYYNLGII